MSDDLVEWLRAQLDERARVARAACHGGEGRWHQTDPDREHGRIEDERGEVVTYDEGSPSGHQAAHIVLHDPATELREVEAKRQIIDSWEAGQDDNLPPLALIALDEVVKALALPYADRPGYRSEWAPSARRVNQT